MPSTTPLNALERSLVESVERGEAFDLSDGPADETAMRSWGETRTIRSHVIRDVLLGRLAPEPDPHGIDLRGARIDGRLDLMNVTSRVAIRLTECLLDRGVEARYADLGPLRMTDCLIEHPTHLAFIARQLRTPILVLRGTTIIGHGERALFLREARIGGELNLNGATLRSHSGSALDGSTMRVDGPVDMREGFTATAHGPHAAINLQGARIGGGIDCGGAVLHNSGGPALHADSLEAEGPLLLRDGFTATGSGPRGAVGLMGAELTTLECTGTVRNDSGPALFAESVVVDGQVLLRDGFTARGSGETGAVVLRHARIGGGLEFSRATVRNGSGPALGAGHLRLGGALALDVDVDFVGAGGQGTVALTSARIDGEVVFDIVELTNGSGPAVRMSQARLGRSLTFTNCFWAVGAGSDATVDLSDVTVGGAFRVTPRHIGNSGAPGPRLAVNGLTHTGVPQGVTTAEWLEVLRTGTPEYAAQPYQHLAAAERAAGHDSSARRVLMAQRRDQIDRHALTGALERGWARLTGLTLGYGYQPWRALLGLFLVLLVAGAAAGYLGGWGGLAKVRSQAAAPVEGCALIDRIGFGLDAGAPLITGGARARCEPTGTGWGTVLTVASWVLKALAWAFATLFVAGFTGAVRRT
ncbi:hypothetical protein [Umezawaea sp.]|uniref:hypothetical protein n=1 Tax=Umezawaea sp. TaxID=1955258 RepID=UPI002ED121C7